MLVLLDYEALLVPKLLDAVKTICRRCLTRNASGQWHSEGGLFRSEGGLNHSEGGLYGSLGDFTIRKTVYMPRPVLHVLA